MSKGGIKIAILVIILVLAGLYFWWPGSSKVEAPTKTDTSATTTDTKKVSLYDELLNSEVRVPELDVRVKLNDGGAGFELADLPGGIGGSVFVGKNISAIQANDLLAILVVNSGGTGTFNYLTLFTKEYDILIQQDFEYLGDRIKIESIDIASGLKKDEYQVTVSYLDRSPGEAFAVVPTLPSSKRFIVRGGELIPTE